MYVHYNQNAIHIRKLQLNKKRDSERDRERKTEGEIDANEV